MGDRPVRDADANVGILEILGDLADVCRRQNELLLELAPAHPNQAAFTANVNGLQGRVEPVLTIANRLGRRADTTRNPTSLTVLPDPAAPVGAPGAWGAQPMNAQHLRSIDKFTGSAADRGQTVYAWLEASVAVALANGYGPEGLMGVLLSTSVGGVFEYITRERAAGKDVYGIVQGLEIRYGTCLTPADARTKMASKQRNMSEPINVFVDEIWTLARIAERDREAGQDKQDAMEAHVRQHVLRSLDPPISRVVNDKLEQYVVNNAVPMTLNELEALVIRLEQDRQEKRRQEKFRQSQLARAQAVQVDEAGGAGSDEEYLVNAMLEQKKRDREKGRQPSVEKAVAAAIKSYNNRLIQTGQGAAAAGPPGVLDERKRAIFELLALANCEKGECLQCGRKGHIKGNLKCPLRGKPLTDRPCLMCAKGLHAPADCLAHHIGPGGAIDQVEAGSEDNLNGM